MWMVMLNGSWQPADDDGVVFAWIRQGSIGPQTPIRHSSWAYPQMLGYIPVFAQAFGGHAAPSVAHPAAVHGPRMHPRAATALVLGLFSIGCGFMGVFAIRSARRVLAEVAESKGAYRSAPEATAALAVGWIGVFLLPLIVFVNLALASEKGAIALLGLAVFGAATTAIGGFVPSAPAPAKALAKLVRASPVVASLCVALPAASALIGLRSQANARESAAMRCRDARAELETTLAGDEFNAARTALARVGRDCPGFAESEKIAADITEREAAAEQRAADEEQAARLRAAQQKEKLAVETFPARSAEAAAKLKSASVKTAQGKWEAANSDVNAAEHILDSFKGTSVESSPQGEVRTQP